MTDLNNKIDILWDDNPIDVTSDANFIWGIANKLRGVYMPDKYGDVIIPMTIIRRFECALESTKSKVVTTYKNNANYPFKAMCKITGFQFFNTSEFTLKELLNDPDHIGGDNGNFKSYLNGFSSNVREILNGLDIDAQIKKMEEGGCLYNVIKDFSELDLSLDKYDSIRMGYIFENLIGRFFQNVDAGQFYTGRDIIKTLVSILVSEGCDDIFDDHKVITVCDQACGTGGMLSTAYSYLKHFNETADVRLFGQEYMAVSYSVGLAEMLIKGQNAENFRHTDTFKEDCFKDTKMRFVIENPPFGTPWKGEKAKKGQEEAVKEESKNGLKGRWGAGLPGGGDSQLIFMQSAINKMDDKYGRAAIISNGSPLFSGGTSSGESQIRRWMIESDLIEAIIALPTDLFYNTGIATYVWILSKNKRDIRKGKIQLIDCSSDKFYTKLRKSVGNKRNEISPENRKDITKLYNDFVENEYSKIFNKEEFLYREYSVMQPLQRSYSITSESIASMISKGSLSSLYDEAKVFDLENPSVDEKPKENETENDKKKRLEKEAKKIRDNKKKLQFYYDNKPLYDEILSKLEKNIDNKIYYNELEFELIIKGIFDGLIDKKLISKIVDGLSVMDKKAAIHKDKKGFIIYDLESKDIEIVPFLENISTYMEREVLPHIPDAKAFFEGKNEKASFVEDIAEKNIKIGAEIPFTRYFYSYKVPEESSKLANEFHLIEESLKNKLKDIF